MVARMRRLAGKVRRRARRVAGRSARDHLRGRARFRAHRLRQQARTGVGRTVGLRLRSHGLRARGHSSSDHWVFHEIFGAEDAYKRDELVPLMRGGTVVEIGAHKGYFTILAGSVADRVIVFEPDETNFRFLLDNVALNGQGNVTALKQAVMSEAGTRTFSVSGITDARHTFFPSHFSGAGRQIEVQCTTLPDAFREHGVEVVDVLKLDCEGSEYDVIFGCDAETLSRVRCIVFELHESPQIEHTEADLVRFLESHGFTGEIYDVHQRDDVRTAMGFFRRV